jgi:MurNAc alpha-1-phosphate uridylyltransferase
MILAAGFGTRMRPLTETRPKPLIEVAGRSLIDRTLDLAFEIQPERVVVNAHYLASMMIDHLDARDVTVLHETPDILDSGGGLKNALDSLGSEPVFTSNADVIWKGPNPFDCVRSAWDPDRMDALLLCVPMNRTVGRDTPGDFTLEADGQLTRGGDHAYGGIQIIKTERIAAHKERVFGLNPIWDDMADNGRLFGTTYPGTWCDIGTPAGIPLAEALLNEDQHA